MSRERLLVDPVYFQKLLKRSVVFPVTVSFVLAGLFYLLIHSLLSVTRWVDHSDQVVAGITLLQKHLLDAETGLRGYIITSDPVFLEPWDKALSVIPSEFQRMKNLVSDKPGQARVLSKIEASANDWIVLSKKAQSHVGQGPISHAEMLIRKNLMDAIRAEVDRFTVTENHVRDERNNEVQRMALGLSTIGILVAFFVGVSFFVRSRGTMTRLVQLYENATVELLKNREWYSTTLKSIGDAVIVVDSHLQIEFMNHLAEDLTGWSIEKARGRPMKEVFNIVNEHTGQPILNPVDRVLNEGVVVDLANDTTLLARNGLRTPIEDSGAPIRDSGGNILGVVLVFRDVTQKHRAEDALRESEQKLRRFYESGLLGVMYWDTNGTITDSNDKFLELTGYTRDDLNSGRINWEKMTPPEYSHLDEISLTELRTTGVNLKPFEKEYFRQDGSRVPVLVAGAMLNRKGSIGVAFVLDISEQKKAEEALRQSEEQFRTLANAISQLAWIAKADGYIYWYNQRWYEYTGTIPAQMEGWGWQRVHDPKMLPEVLERWKSSIETGQPFDMEFPLRSADGVFRAFLTRAVPIYDNRGRVERWFGTNTDVEDQRLAREEFKQLLAARDEFISIISHELKTPITPLNLEAHTLEKILKSSKSLPPDRIVKFVSSVKRQVYRLTSIVNDMVDVSEINIGQLSMNLRQFDLGHAVTQVVSRLRNENQASSNLSVELEDNLMCHGDVSRIECAIEKLLANAFKYGGGKPISVRLTRVGQELACLSIIDHGIGISRSDQGRIFARFERGISARHISGFGLGLYIANQIIQAHHGTLRLQSEQGKGSTFSIMLPLVKNEHSGSGYEVA